MRLEDKTYIMIATLQKHFIFFLRLWVSMECGPEEQPRIRMGQGCEEFICRPRLDGLGLKIIYTCTRPFCRILFVDYISIFVRFVEIGKFHVTKTNHVLRFKRVVIYYNWVFMMCKCLSRLMNLMTSNSSRAKSRLAQMEQLSMKKICAKLTRSRLWKPYSKVSKVFN